MARTSRLGLVLVLFGLAAACGKTTADGTASGGASGMGGGTGGSSATGGVGGAPSGGASGCAPVVPIAPCLELSESECLAAHPRCAPVYDDTCCSSCNPGPCADCVSWQFVECIDYELSACVPGTIGHCGLTPTWVCSGGQADCSDIEGSYCEQTPGCVRAELNGCPAGEPCDAECHAVTAGSCGPVCDPAPVPDCGAGKAPEIAGGAPTGFCIPASVCAAQLNACPPAPPVGEPCSVPGATCTYGDWCATVCVCENGTYACATPPC